MKTNWYEQFFHGLALQFWRGAVSAEVTASECEFIESELNVSPGSKVLDVPCGNGRHSIELAKRGYEMTGLDLCPEFIADAEQSCSRDRVRVRLLNADMRQLSFDEQFDGAFCFGNSFGYVDYADTIRFLEGMQSALKPGGKFLVETGMAAESVLPSLQARRWHRAGDVLALTENRYDAVESKLNTEYTFIQNGAIETSTALYSIYTVAEIIRLFSNAGFAVQKLYATTRRETYSVGSPRLLLTTQRT